MIKCISILDQKKKCISINQLGFVSGMSILDNGMASNSIVHFIKSKIRGIITYIPLKFDIIKAYDKIDRSYLFGILCKMRFSNQWISCILLCVES
jgi:hypothetical protein